MLTLCIPLACSGDCMEQITLDVATGQVASFFSMCRCHRMTWSVQNAFSECLEPGRWKDRFVCRLHSEFQLEWQSVPSVALWALWPYWPQKWNKSDASFHRRGPGGRPVWESGTHVPPKRGQRILSPKEETWQGHLGKTTMYITKSIQIPVNSTWNNGTSI